MLRGSCLCGRVKYEAKGPLSSIVRCHCDQCRKASGSEFACNGAVPASGFRVLQGEELLKYFEYTPGGQRTFCSHCGSPLFKRNLAAPEVVRLRLGCLDVEVDGKPLAHLFVSEKPAWSEITDDLPQHARLPQKFRSE
jgi:hypothetical protein